MVKKGKVPKEEVELKPTSECPAYANAVIASRVYDFLDFHGLTNSKVHLDDDGALTLTLVDPIGQLIERMRSNVPYEFNVIYEDSDVPRNAYLRSDADKIEALEGALSNLETVYEARRATYEERIATMRERVVTIADENYKLRGRVLSLEQRLEVQRERLTGRIRELQQEVDSLKETPEPLYSGIIDTEVPEEAADQIEVSSGEDNGIPIGILAGVMRFYVEQVAGEDPDAIRQASAKMVRYLNSQMPYTDVIKVLNTAFSTGNQGG
ncbi:hypothetical protein ACFL1B_02630 [Nanoarchaeota archaeon]